MEREIVRTVALPKVVRWKKKDLSEIEFLEPTGRLVRRVTEIGQQNELGHKFTDPVGFAFEDLTGLPYAVLDVLPARVASELLEAAGEIMEEAMSPAGDDEDDDEEGVEGKGDDA